MAGLWPLSYQQRHDLNGKPLVGARAYFFEAGTTTPLDTFRDYDLALPHPHPLLSDGFGMFPGVFLDEATAFYRSRVTTSGGEELFDIDGIPVIGPSGGGGGGGGGTPVDPYALAETGDVKWRYGFGTRPGWVRCNGRTVGSAVSGATERANADAEDLFNYLWQTDTNLTVSGGRGASSAADWAANKTIILPDLRGSTLFGLDDMGHTTAGRITAATIVSGTAIALGSRGGFETITLTAAQTPAHTHTGTTSSDGAHTHTYEKAVNTSVHPTGSGRSDVNTTDPDTTSSSGAHTHTFTTSSVGGDEAHNNMPPFLLGTFYLKL